MNKNNTHFAIPPHASCATDLNQLSLEQRVNQQHPSSTLQHWLNQQCTKTPLTAAAAAAGVSSLMSVYSCCDVTLVQQLELRTAAAVAAAGVLTCAL